MAPFLNLISPKRIEMRIQRFVFQLSLFLAPCAISPSHALRASPPASAPGIAQAATLQADAETIIIDVRLLISRAAEQARSGEFGRAATGIQSAIADYQQRYSPDCWVVKYCGAFLAEIRQIERETDKAREARAEFWRALNGVSFAPGKSSETPEFIRLYAAVRELGSSAGTDTPTYYMGLVLLGRLADARCDFTAAASLFERGQNVCIHCFGTDGPDYADSLHLLADAKFKLGQYRESIELYKKLLPARERCCGRLSINYTYALVGLARAEFMERKYAAAEASARSAVSTYESLGVSERIGPVTRSSLAMTLFAQGKSEEADVEYAKAEETGARCGLTASELANIYEAHADSFAKRGRMQEAAKMHGQAAKLRVSTAPMQSNPLPMPANRNNYPTTDENRTR